MKTILTQNFGVTNKLYYGIFNSSCSKVEISSTFLFGKKGKKWC